MLLRGTVRSGRREAAGFVSVPWVTRQLRELFDLVPFPGTLNLHLDDPHPRRVWAALRHSGNARLLRPPDGSGFCAAEGYPVWVNARVPGVIVVPQVDEYPDNVVEVVAAVNLRQRFDLEDGTPCRALLGPDPGTRFAAVLFDLEGTLVDFQWQLDAAHKELRAAAGGLGFDPAQFAQDNYAAIRHRALDLSDSPEAVARIDRHLGPIYDRYDLDALSRWSLREGAGDLLDDLRACGIRTALVSNIGRAGVTGALERFRLADRLDAVVTRDDVVRMKPVGEGIRKAMAQLKVAPHQTLMVGDSLSDLGAARDAGVAVALVVGGESDPAAIDAGRPDHRLGHLLEVGDLI